MAWLVTEKMSKAVLCLFQKDPDATTEANGIRTTNFVKAKGRADFLNSETRDTGFHNDSNFWVMRTEEVREVSAEGRASCAPTVPY